MTSLIGLMRQCLPIHAAWTQAADRVPRGITPPAANFRRSLEIQKPGTPITEKKPDVPNKSYWNKVQSAFGWDGVIALAPLWAYTFQGKAEVTGILCRAREQGYKTHRVLEKLTYGCEGKPLVKIETKTGDKFDLPLEEKFLFAQFKVNGGKVIGGESTMWPLDAEFDKGFVQVYIYQPTVKGNKLSAPLNPFQPKGKGKWKPVREEEKKTFEALLPAGIQDKDAWLEAFTADYDGKGDGDYKQTTAPVGTTETVEVHVPNFVVVVSLGTCCERADFEPGGIVGMAKIFPHIMVSAQVALKSSEGTIRVERPAQTTAEDQGDGQHAKPCCGALKEIGAILVADGNEFGGVDSQKPFWGGVFAYFEEDADKRLGGKKLHVVDTSKINKEGHRRFPRGKRLLVHRPPAIHFYPTAPIRSVKAQLRELTGMPLRQSEAEGVVKVDRQGEFDNIHLAPALKLDLAKIRLSEQLAPVRWVANMSKGAPKLPPSQQGKSLTVDPVACKTEKVWMAPFCSHDCFHTHWRWLRGETAPWALGWDEVGPYRKSGAPMVPVYQDVWLTLHGPGSYSYHVKSTYPDNHSVGTWDIFMHHGAAYAQSIANWLLYGLSNLNIGLGQDYEFYDSNNKKLTIRGNPELMYWLFRYVVVEKDGKPAVVERIQFDQKDVDAARVF